MSRLGALGLLLGIVTLGACSDTIVPSPQATVTIVAGSGQSATVLGVLAEPLTIAVTTPDGAGVPGAGVEWTVTTGGGWLSVSSNQTDAQGRASVTWTLGNVTGAQSVAATVTGLIGSTVNFSAVATPPIVPRGPIVIHYDGTSWSPALEDVNGANVSLASIWGASPSLVLAVGGWCGGSLMVRLDGTAWSQPPPNCVGVSLSKFTGVWGSSASNIFATYRNGIPPKLGGSILHYDGQGWRYAYAANCDAGLGTNCPAFQAVWTSSPADAFAVGDRGMIAHYDGTNWTPQESGTTVGLYAVWGVASADAVFAVGPVGTILYYDGSTWGTQASGTTQPLYAVWGTSANDVFAVGGAGTVLHYDGTAWTAQNSGTGRSLYGVWGTSANAVFAVGDASTIIYYNGTSWTSQSTTAAMNLHGVWGSSPANVYAVGASR